jgi:hypothetical protein
MIAQRVDNDGFEIVRASTQVLVTSSSGSLLAGTLQLLTRDDMFEQPLSSKGIDGNGWSGKIVDVPTLTLPGTIEPFAWIKPKILSSPIKKGCLELTWSAAGELSIKIPDSIKPLWEATGAPADHGYSLKPTLLIKGCFEAKFKATTPGALPDREDEGSLAVFPGKNGVEKYGIVVDVDTDTKKGFVVPLTSVVTPNVLEALGLK